MKNYDFIFPLGFSCGATQALRAAGLQFASYPLDWVGSPGIVQSAQLVADGFEGWLEADDLKLWDVRHGPGFNTRIYRNQKNGFGFSHEFSDFFPFAATYPKVRETYDRRSRRFLERFEAAKKVLAVYMEIPFRKCPDVAQIAEGRRLLRLKAPSAEIDMLVFYAEPGVRVPEVRSETEGITLVACDYRKFDEGEITHFVEYELLVPYLKANYTITDTRTDEDRKTYEAILKNNDTWRWGVGKSRLRQWWNQRVYKLYRGLEKYLQKRNLIDKEGPLWFVEK